MLTYDQLPDHARLWIYPANRNLTAEEVNTLETKLGEFTDQWTSHQQDLDAFGGIWANRFLVIGVDEERAAASGCSIDKSVRTVQQLGESIEVDFFDRNILYVLAGDQLIEYPVNGFKAAYLKGDISDETTVIDPLVQTKAAAKLGFRKPLASSWHKRFT